MDPRSLLVTAITLLFREGQLENQTENSTGIVRNILMMIKTPEVTITIDPSTEIIVGLKNLVQSMVEQPLGHEFTVVEIMQQVAVIAKEDDSLVSAIERGIAPELTEKHLKRACVNMRKTLSNYFREETVRTLLQNAHYKLKFDRPNVESIPHFIQMLVAELEPYQQDALAVDPAIVDSIDFNQLEELARVYKAIQDEANGDMKLIAGYRGLNRMLGGGIRRGEEIVIGALQHNYKTGFSLSIFRQIAIYNPVKLYDPKKKGLLLRISFEDDLILNLQFLYSSFKQLETGIFPDTAAISAIPPEVMAAYVQERMQAQGWTVKLLRVDPTKWTYIDLINLVLSYEAEGYEVAVCMVDYLKMLPTTGCTQGATGQDIRDLFRRIRNFFSPRRTTFITPHQLSTQAKELVRMGVQDFVKEIANKGYYDGCKTLDNEVDLELYIHIEEHFTGSWLTVQRGKHRKIGQTPKEDLYMALPFTKGGIILDDINGEEITRRKIGAGPVGSVDEKPHWCLDNEF